MWYPNTLDMIFPKINPLPSSDAVRQQKKIILEDLFSSVLSQLKKYNPSGNLKFKYLSISQSLKLRILMGKILRISLYLNFTPNTLGCYELNLGRLSNSIHFPFLGLIGLGTSKYLNFPRPRSKQIVRLLLARTDIMKTKAVEIGS